MSYWIPAKLYRKLHNEVMHGRLPADFFRENAELFQKFYERLPEQHRNSFERLKCACEQPTSIVRRRKGLDLDVTRDTIWRIEQLLSGVPPVSEYTAMAPLWVQYCSFFLPRDKREDRLGDLVEWLPTARQMFHPIWVWILVVYHVASWVWPSACWIGRKLSRLGVLGWLFRQFDT